MYMKDWTPWIVIKYEDQFEENLQVLYRCVNRYLYWLEVFEAYHNWFGEIAS